MVIRRGDCVNIREPCRKGHSISAPPTGGGADGSCSNTSDNALRVVGGLQRSRGWKAGEKKPFVEIAPLRRDTTLTAALPAPVRRGLSGMSGVTPSHRLSGINVKHRGALCLPLKF